MKKSIMLLLALLTLSLPCFGNHGIEAIGALFEMIAWVAGIYILIVHFGCAYAYSSGSETARVIFGFLYLILLLITGILCGYHLLFIFPEAIFVLFFYAKIIKTKNKNEL